MNKKKNEIHFFLILTFLILIVGFLLRFHRINETLIFVYDQGRDALKVQEILRGKFTLIGPITGIAGFFLGPFYYYFILIPYYFFQGNPVGVIFFLIILDLLGIFIAAKMVKEKNNWESFLICVILLTFNYSHIQHSRWLSNPNPILWLSPLFFCLLFLYLSKKSLKIFKIDLIYFLGFLLGLLFQTELANAIFFIPTFLLIHFFVKKRFDFRNILKFFIGFLVTLLPLIIFNLRHDFIMIQALKNFLSQKGESVILLELIKKRPTFYLKTLTFFISPKNQAFLFFLGFSVLVYLLKKRFWQDKKLIILFSWLTIPLLLMLFYTFNKGDIWTYYLISQPIPFLLLLSLALTDLRKKLKKIGFIVVSLIIGAFILINLKEWQMLTSDEANLISFGNMKKTVDFIYQEAQGKPFNVDVFVPNFLPAAYDYLFSWYGPKKHGYLPTPKHEREKLLFYIIEPGQKYKDGEQYWRDWWYNQRKHSGKIIKSIKIGEIDIEMRERISL